VTAAAMIFTPMCRVKLPPTNLIPITDNGLAGGQGWGWDEKLYFALAMSIWGALGSVLDSFLGGLLQHSVRDTRSGRIVEGDGGKRVLLSGPGPNSLHFRKRAELKAQLLNGEGKDAIPKQGRSDQVVNEKVEAELDRKMGGIKPYDTNEKFRQHSYGDGEPTRVVESGLGLLDNNEVNFLMALTMSLGAMVVAGGVWGVPLESIYPF